MARRKPPTTRLFNGAAWAGPLATMTLTEWQKSGGCGTCELSMAAMCQKAKTNAKRLAGWKLMDLATLGWGGRVMERHFARFAAEHTEQLAPALRGLATMVTFEFDQVTGEQTSKVVEP